MLFQPASWLGYRKVPVRTNLLLASVVTLVMLAAVEATVRLVYRAPWYAQVEAEERMLPLTAYHWNRDGLRDQDYGPKPPAVRRILMLGDSFTWGIGVMDDEAIFARLLEKQLGVEILNGGRPGSVTGQWIELWRHVGPAFDPDLVVLVYFLRDVMRPRPITMIDRVRRDLAAEHEKSWLYRWSALARLIQDQRDRRTLGRYYATQYLDAYVGDERATEGWRLAQWNLAVIQNEAQARGIPTVLVVFPLLIDLDREPYPFQPIMDQVETFARKRAMPALSLLPVFRGRDARTLWVSPVDQHPNAEGHALAAAAMAPFLRAQLSRLQRAEPATPNR
jgi:lysophospholipase L1-like esterase